MVIHSESSLPLHGKQEGLIVYTNPVFPRIGMTLGLVLSLALLGCASTHPIALGPGQVEAEGRRVSAERSGVRATVAFDQWVGEPRDLGRTLLLFHLVVENGSPQVVHLPLERITLLDPARRQWHPLTREQAHALALSARGPSGPIISFGVGGGSGGVGYGIGAGIPIGGPSGLGYPEVLTRGFVGDEIPVGGRVEGLLYFARLDPEVARFSLLLSPVGAEELSFDFAMSQ